MPQLDRSVLQAALVGYQPEADRIKAAIADLKKSLHMHGGSQAQPTTEALAPRKRRRLSAAARKRIAEAQKKRWAEYHKQQKPA